MQLITAFLIGLIFGLGMSISGMANPAKFINVFDISGHWDPSLAFAIGGALAVTFAGWHLAAPDTGMTDVFIFVATLVVGIIGARWVQSQSAAKPADA